MAVAFPASIGFESVRMLPSTGITRLREAGGLLVTGRNRDAYWSAEFVTGSLSRAEHADLTAFLVDCIERNERVDFVHWRHRLPRAYTSADWPLDADPTLDEVTDLYTLSVAGLETGMTLKRGDRLTLIQDELRCYRMLSADVTVASETAQAISVVPRLPIGVFAPAALVRLEDPPVRLAIVPESVETSEVYSQSPIRFEAEEALA